MDPFKGKGKGKKGFLMPLGMNPPGEALRGVRPQTFGQEALPEGKGFGKGKEKGKDFYHHRPDGQPPLPMTPSTFPQRQASFSEYCIF